MSRSIKRCLTATVTSVFVLSAGSIAFVRPAHAALWEYRFTGVFYSDPGQAVGTGIGIGIFNGVDGADPQGASFVFSATFDDNIFAYSPPQWDGTNYFMEWFNFPVVAATITRGTQFLSLSDGSFQVERSSSGTYIWFVGSSGFGSEYGADQTFLGQFYNPLPMLPAPLTFSEFSGGNGEGLHSQYAVSSLRYRFNDASLTLVPAPAAAPLLALAGLTVRGRRRR